MTANMSGRSFLRSESQHPGECEYTGGFTPLKMVDENVEGEETPRASEIPHRLAFNRPDTHGLRSSATGGRTVTPRIDTPTEDGSDGGGVSLEGVQGTYAVPQKQGGVGDALMRSVGTSGNMKQGASHGLGGGIGSIDAIVRAPLTGTPGNTPPAFAQYTYPVYDNYHEKDRFSSAQPRPSASGAAGIDSQSSFTRQGNRNKHSAYVDQRRAGTPGGVRALQEIFGRPDSSTSQDQGRMQTGRITPGAFNGPPSYNTRNGFHPQSGFGSQAQQSIQQGVAGGVEPAEPRAFSGHLNNPAQTGPFAGGISPFAGANGFNGAPNNNLANQGGFTKSNYNGARGPEGFNAMQGGFQGFERPHSAASWNSDVAMMPAQQNNYNLQGGLGALVSYAHGSQQGPLARTNSYVSSSSSGHDSMHDMSCVHKAKALSHMIMSGACDPGEDYDFGKKKIYGPMTYYGNKKAGEVSPTKYRPGRNAHLQADRASMMAAAAQEKDTRGSAVAFIGIEPRPNPTWLYHVAFNYTPTLEQVFDILLITEPCRQIAPSSAGVVRLMGFPFEAPRAEITALLCRQAKIVSQPLGSPYFAVHVIMERSTGKTNDAFIELATEGEAMRVVMQAEKRALNGRPIKMGDRSVEVVMSCQEDLMHELFEKAKKIVWVGNTPVVSTQVECYYPGISSEGFDGFVGMEELHEMLQRCDHPQRYFHITRHQPRLFEHWISTLVKYPWHAIDCVSIAERDRLFDSTMKIVGGLVACLEYAAKKEFDVNKPTFSTLRELTVTVLTCPGFSEAQKAAYVRFMCEKDLAAVCDPKGTNLTFGGVRVISACWPFKVLAIDPAASKEMLEYFMYLMQEASKAQEKSLRLAERSRRRVGGPVSGPFGKINIDYKGANTIAEVGEVELDYVEEMLRRVLE